MHMQVGAGPEAHRREGASGVQNMQVGADPEGLWSQWVDGDPNM